MKWESLGGNYDEYIGLMKTKKKMVPKVTVIFIRNNFQNVTNNTTKSVNQIKIKSTN